VSGKTIDILNDYPILLQEYVYKILVLYYLPALGKNKKARALYDAGLNQHYRPSNYK
jgi:hypothetical protein